MRTTLCAWAAGLAVSFLGVATAQEILPGDETTLPPVTVRPSEEGTSPPYSAPPRSYYRNYSSPNVSWSSGAIGEDQTLVGPYNQPAWTTRRPFATTRTYVLPPGTAEVSQWVRPTWKEDEEVEFRMLEEFAIGLPGRFQLDVYERWNIEEVGAEPHEANHEGVQIELRWALADWGDIPLNPTLYAEWVERGGPQEKPNKYELKLLLSDSLFENLYYSSNLILEQETSGEHETELGWSHALGTTLIDQCLLGGVEMVLSGTTVAGARDDQEVSFMIGPSLQWRPTNRMFVDVVGLFGTTPESPVAQMYVICGWQFGVRAGPSRNYYGRPVSSYFGGNGEISGPASTRGN
jgi:hypothetical protein